MISCERCKLILDDGTRHCPRCGDPLGVPDPHKPQRRSDVHTLLASANLSRVRSEWDEAIEFCMEALKLEPKNPEIYSLLGDIYNARGQDEEAAQWFTMALELAPGNTEDRIKLERLQGRLAKSDSAKLPIAGGDHGSWFDRFAGGKGLDSSVRIITLVSVIFVCLLLLAGLLAFIWRSPNLESEMEDAAHIRNRSGESALANSERNRETIIEPLATRSAAEQQIITALSSDERIRARIITVEDVKMDPRVSLLMITFHSSGSMTKNFILADAMEVANAAFGPNPGGNWIMVRCYGNVVNDLGVSEPELLFIADVERNSAMSVTAQSPREELESIFLKPWWNSKVQ